MKRVLDALLLSRISLKVDQSASGHPNILSLPIQILVTNTLKIGDNFQKLTDERFKTLSSTGYSGTSIKKSDIPTLSNLFDDCLYSGIGRKKINT